MARPLRYEEPASRRIQFRVTPTQQRALAQVARDARANVSRVIRDAVNEYVADYGERKVFRPDKT